MLAAQPLRPFIVVLTVVFAAGAEPAAADDGAWAESCHRVLDEIGQLRQPESSAKVLHEAIVSGGSIGAECRIRLTELLGEACEKLDGVDLYSCVELLGEAVSVANVPLSDRWAIQTQPLSKALEQHRRDGDLTAAGRMLEDLHRVTARSPESMRSDLLQSLLLEEGSFYLRTGQLDKAKGTYSELLTMARRSEDRGMGDVVFALRGLASVYEAQGELHESRDYLEQAIEFIENRMGGKDSPALVLPLEQYSRLLEKLDEKELSVTARERADRLRDL